MQKSWTPLLYIENPKDSTTKLLELMNEFSKVAGYKIHIQKSFAFLCANNELTEREIKKAIIHYCYAGPIVVPYKFLKYLF